MYRNVVDDFATWFESNCQVLLVKGARGVGKTWMAKDFAEAFFKRVLIVDFEQESDLRGLFQGSVDADKIDSKLKSRFRSGRRGQPVEEILLDQDTMLVFDEIQLIRQPLPGIMAYAMQRPDIRICMIASWMGTLDGEDFYDDLYRVTMYPMTFEEYLTAHKAQELCKHIERQKIEVVDANIKKEIRRYLNDFMITGGMPAVVAETVRTGTLSRVDALLERITAEQRAFIRQMVPHALERKVIKVWDSLPVQLEKPNRKFMYGYVDEKARAREYEGAVNWLVDAGLVRQIFRVSQGVYPLDEHEDRKSFELYHLDHGLLRAMCGVWMEDMKHPSDVYEVLGGVLTEQYTIAELTMNQNVHKLYFWISGATARVDFVFEDDGEVIPVDVQSKVRSKAQSLKVFYKNYSNRMAIRISLDDLNFSKGILNIPLYGLWNF